MASTPRLTEGALGTILSGGFVERPIVQILAQKNVSADSVQRYRFLLSDGKFSYQCCIMVGAMAQRVEAGEFERYTVIRLNKYVCNPAAGGSNKKILLISEPEVITPGANIGRKIGNPTPFEGSSIANDSLSSTFANGVSSTSGGSTNGGYNGFKSGAKAFSSVPNQADISMSDTSIREEAIFPINQITPYQNKWAIRGRVTNKGTLKSWNNAKGEGTLFSFNLQDESGEIRITAFRTECDKYFDMIQVGKIYTLAKASVKPANKKWSDVDHEYELTLHSDSIIIPSDDDTSCPQINFHFVKIGQLEAVPANSTVDILGVCRDPGEMTTIMSKNLGKELRKRDISLVDDSETEIRLTIWNNDAETFNAQCGSVIVAKKARLTDYQGKSLSTIGSTLIQVDPDLPEANELRGWYQRRGINIEPNVLSQKSGSADMGDSQYLNAITKDNVVAAVNATLTTTCKATVTQTGKTQIYMACPDGCKKKLVEMNNGFYKCDKCNKDVMHGDHRLILNLLISDCTNSVWVTAFHEEAEKLLGMSAKDLADMKSQNDEEFLEYVATLNFRTFQFRIRAKIDNYKEESRIRSNLVSVNPINTVDYCRKLIKEINEMIV
ncbi:replication protein A 70 kDa DNA-binding subunit-like [Panonychus citri]|uniref:replication protein A 70 kDa DNA-binding subunit-like n=1 Tax=Panonychus citri TaxID=50023 RepID=UPI002306E921|nr:replication protein A 70 kDa DNA-binding subunit-like [Panonychus citri]